MSVFSQVTVPPRSIITVLGRKQELVSSHPGVDEPGALTTIPCSLVDSGITTDSGSKTGVGYIIDSTTSSDPPTTTCPCIHG